jgi:5-methylcytosine-specific restriction endonuclease McrA
MELELETLNTEMKKDISLIRDKYKNKKTNIIKQYKLLEKRINNSINCKIQQSLNTKPKRINIPKTVKDKLWDDTYGSKCGEGSCYVCSIVINSKQFECGHIVAVAKGGNNNINNLKPICATCNKSMSVKNLEEFKKEYFSSKTETNLQSEQVTYCNRSSVQEQNNKFNIICNLIRDIDIKNNQHNNISYFASSNLFLEQFITNIPGIMNVSYLKNDTLSNIIREFGSSSFINNTNSLSCKYGIPNINDRITFIKTLISQIDPYRELMERVNILL